MILFFLKSSLHGVEKSGGVSGVLVSAGVGGGWLLGSQAFGSGRPGPVKELGAPVPICEAAVMMPPPLPGKVRPSEHL